MIRNYEARAILLINALTTIGASDVCRRKAIPFICLYLFELCGGSGVAISPTSSQYKEIRDRLASRSGCILKYLGLNLRTVRYFLPWLHSVLQEITVTLLMEQPQCEVQYKKDIIICCGVYFYG